MGLLKAHLKLIGREAQNCPIRGRLAMFGRQQMFFTKSEACDILPDLAPRLNGSEESESEFTVEQLFEGLGAEEVNVIDYSDYEGADIILDLNKPISSELESAFDVIFDSGTIEHVFDIAAALRNIDSLLKPGGSVIICSPCSNTIDHGFYSLNPTLYFDFFGGLGYTGMQGYLRESNPLDVGYLGKTYAYSGVSDQMILSSRLAVEVCFFGTKPEKALPNKEYFPIQSLYSDVYKALDGESGDDSPEPRKEFGEFQGAVFRILRKLDKFGWLDQWLLNQAWYNRARFSGNLDYLGRF